MSYIITFSKKAENDIEFHKNSGNKAVLNKLYTLLNELVSNPFEGIGKPERLKYALKNNWSRRINGEHRLVYEIMNDTIVIHSVKGHY